MRDLEPKHIETLVAIRGNVVRCSSVMPDMREACFRCTNRSHNDPTVSHNLKRERVLIVSTIRLVLIALECTQQAGIFLDISHYQGAACGHEERVPLAAGYVDEPLQCIKCQAKYSFELVS